LALRRRIASSGTAPENDFYGVAGQRRIDLAKRSWTVKFGFGLQLEERNYGEIHLCRRDPGAIAA